MRMYTWQSRVEYRHNSPCCENPFIQALIAESAGEGEEFEVFSVRLLIVPGRGDITSEDSTVQILGTVPLAVPHQRVVLSRRFLMGRS